MGTIISVNNQIYTVHRGMHIYRKIFETRGRMFVKLDCSQYQYCQALYCTDCLGASIIKPSRRPYLTPDDFVASSCCLLRLMDHIAVARASTTPHVMPTANPMVSAAGEEEAVDGGSVAAVSFEGVRGGLVTVTFCRAR